MSDQNYMQSVPHLKHIPFIRQGLVAFFQRGSSQRERDWTHATTVPGPTMRLALNDPWVGAQRACDTLTQQQLAIFAASFTRWICVQLPLSLSNIRSRFRYEFRNHACKIALAVLAASRVELPMDRTIHRRQR